MLQHYFMNLITETALEKPDLKKSHKKYFLQNLNFV